MAQFAQKFCKDEGGASAAEYAVLLTLLTVTMIAGVGSLSSAIAGIFRDVATTINTNA